MSVWLHGSRMERTYSCYAANNSHEYGSDGADDGFDGSADC